MVLIVADRRSVSLTNSPFDIVYKIAHYQTSRNSNLTSAITLTSETLYRARARASTERGKGQSAREWMNDWECEQAREKHSIRFNRIAKKKHKDEGGTNAQAWMCAIVSQSLRPVECEVAGYFCVYSIHAKRSGETNHQNSIESIYLKWVCFFRCFARNGIFIRQLTSIQ